MAKAVLLADAIAWYDEDGVRHEADGRGAEVDLPDADYERHLAAGNIAKPGAGAAAAETTGDETAEELADGFKLAELKAIAEAEGVETEDLASSKTAYADAITAHRAAAG